MLPKKRTSRSYFVSLSHYNRLRVLRSRGSESSDSFRSDVSETIASSPTPNPTHQASPFIYHFDEISRAIRDPLSDHLSSSSWICTLREQRAIVFRRRVLDGEIMRSTLSFISGIRHPSLARLLGVALNGDRIFIIYEYLAGSATLKQCLNSSSFSNWASRMQVALDVAKGLEHIHCDCDMVHATIRSSSIVVTERSFNAKIVLFGAASDPAAASADEDVEMRAERLAGHWFSIEEPTGYIAPEVLAGGGRMSKESDVFAFGMFILQLLSGKTPLEYRMNKITLKCERISVIETARHAVGSDCDSDELEMDERERRIRMWVDQKLDDNSFPKGVAEELIRLGLLCVEEDPFMRPEMASVTGTIAKLFLDSIAWEQRGSLAQPLSYGPSQAERVKGPSTSNASSSTTTTPKLSSNVSSSTFGQSPGSGYSIDDVCPEGQMLEDPNLRAFSFAGLRSVTRNFKPETVLGEGGFGRVSKRWVDEKTLNPSKSGLGMPVAVKKLNPEGMQGLEQWQVSGVSSLLGRAGAAGLGKAIEVLDTLGGSLTSLNFSSIFVSGVTTKGNKISILAFEVANTIVKGANLMHSLSKENVEHLKEVVLPSEGVQHLISKDMYELLRMAATDKREELNVFAGEVVRFGNRCKDPQWHNLDRHFYKLGSEITPQSKLKEEAGAMMQQLMTMVQYTAELYHELHALDRFEQDYWRKLQEEETATAVQRGDNLKISRQELKSQRKRVKSLKKKSLWSKILEEVMEKLIDIVHFLHLEIHGAFGSADGDIPATSNTHQRLGPAGLALHYANIVTQIDTLVSRSNPVPPNTRDSLYQGLPPSIKSVLRAKLQSFHVKEELTVPQIKAEVEKTLQWLVPIAANTTKAHHGFGWVGEWANTGIELNRKPTGQTDLIRIETLHHADKEKTEAYILDLVVWLHYLISHSKAGNGGIRSPIKSPIRSPTQKGVKVTLPDDKPSSPTSMLTKEDEEMLHDVSSRKLTPGISKKQELRMHSKLTKSSNASHSPDSGSKKELVPIRRPSTLPVIDFDIDGIKALDVIDGVDTLRML